jgi:hypothetical protein
MSPVWPDAALESLWALLYSAAQGDPGRVREIHERSNG